MIILSCNEVTHNNHLLTEGKKITFPPFKIWIAALESCTSNFSSMYGAFLKGKWNFFWLFFFCYGPPRILFLASRENWKRNEGKNMWQHIFYLFSSRKYMLKVRAVPYFGEKNVHLASFRPKYCMGHTFQVCGAPFSTFEIYFGYLWSPGPPLALCLWPWFAYFIMKNCIGQNIPILKAT